MTKSKIKLAQSLYLEQIRGELLDHFLSKGWYRMGPSIFTSHFILYDNQLYSTIWLRTILKDYALSKSLRKIKKKNNKAFTHVIEPFQQSREIDDLYQVYKKVFKGPLPDTLADYMTHSLESGVYDTRLVKVYHEDKLVACSIFDVGTQSIGSIFGFYHLEYTNYSLGLYTMLIEIDFCQSHAMDYYYMGYFVPGNPRFDYKLRLGHQEYLELKSDSWLAMDKFSYDHTPLAIAHNKLLALQEKTKDSTASVLYKNAFIDAHIIEYFPMDYVEAPLLLLFNNLTADLGEDQLYVCYYDVKSGHYRLEICDRLNGSFSNYRPDWLEKLDSETYKFQLVTYKTIKICKTVAPIERWIENIQSIG